MEPSSVGPKSKKVVLAAAILVALHLSLLLAALPDYIADNDLGFHISLGRQYGEHGIYLWDHLNWAPTGRPNLQGPLLHFSIGILGRALGGQGDDYVLAFSLLALLQWMVAVFTTFWFARKYGGDWAGLFAVALLTGSIWSAGPFFVGVPSGWIFILTPWAIHFFLQKRYALATVFTVLVMYVHLGGSPVAPLGVFLAAVWARDWKGLLKVGTASAVLALPYLIHFALHLSWYNGVRGQVAGDIAVLTYLLALPSLVYLLFQPAALPLSDDLDGCADCMVLPGQPAVLSFSRPLLRRRLPALESPPFCPGSLEAESAWRPVRRSCCWRPFTRCRYPVCRSRRPGRWVTVFPVNWIGMKPGPWRRSWRRLGRGTGSFTPTTIHSAGRCRSTIRSDRSSGTGAKSVPGSTRRGKFRRERRSTSCRFPPRTNSCADSSEKD